MQATQPNIVVDLRRAAGREAGDALVADLGRLRGVSRAWMSVRAPRLLLVDYDPVQTDTQQILATVVRRGFDARLVGM